MLAFWKKLQSSFRTSRAKNSSVSLDLKARYNEGYEFLANGHWQEAEKVFRDLCLRTPKDAEVYSNLGFALKEQGRTVEAISCLNKAVSLDNSLANAHYILGTIAQSSKNNSKAIKHFTDAVTAKPDFAEAFGFLGLLYSSSGLIEKGLEAYEQSLNLNPSLFQTHSALLLTLQYVNKLSRDELFEKHLEYARKFEAPVAKSTTRPNITNPNKRLKIGYVSADFRKHSVALFIQPVIEHHNKNLVEVFCYYNNLHKDEITAEIEKSSDHFVVCADWSNESLVEKIKSDGIDILIDLSGHTSGDRLLAFAQKPAPIQISYLGYVDTTGLSSIDYRLTHINADPIGNEHYYSEKLYRLSEHLWWCYRPAPDLPDVTPLPARKNGFITFVSVNHAAKISRLTIQLWSEILKSLPDSIIYIMGIPQGDGREFLINEFVSRGVNSSRLKLHDWMPLAQYRQTIMEGDIALDTFPYNGGTTTCETLCLGLPIITLAGESFVSRMGLALMSELKLNDFIASTTDEYVEIACNLANEIEGLEALRGSLRARLLSSSICDEAGFTLELEQAYTAMWQQYCASLAESKS